jgi:hypothetical protein
VLGIDGLAAPPDRILQVYAPEDCLTRIVVRNAEYGALFSLWS